jgi:SagB-type dehydrogenase family enzyme
MAGQKAGSVPRTLLARLSPSVRLQSAASGEVVARFACEAVSLGVFSVVAAQRAQKLRGGLPVSILSPGDQTSDSELHVMVQRLARHGLLEYLFKRGPVFCDSVVIEPQVADYWPTASLLEGSDLLVLSRFAYIRRRTNELVLESPRAPALFRINDEAIMHSLAALARPTPFHQLLDPGDSVTSECLAVLVESKIILNIEAGSGTNLRFQEGDDRLALWEFHDLLFHARSTEGRHANPVGGLYPYATLLPPLPAVRPRWRGKKTRLPTPNADTPLSWLLDARHSTRSFDDQQPITVSELSCFLHRTARVRSKWQSKLDPGGPVVAYSVRPYPSAGASYELELYLLVHSCSGLAQGFYHYDAAAHKLTRIETQPSEALAMLSAAEFAMDAPAPPQILIVIAARFGRVSWKYSSVAYELMLKNLGVLTQSFYLMATEMGLGGCAIGTANIDLFAKITGLEFHIEGPLGQFVIGRPCGSK